MIARLVSSRLALWSLTAFTILVSVGGVAYAVSVSHAAADGGRGGAVGVAVSFLMLLAGRATAAAAIEFVMPTLPSTLGQGTAPSTPEAARLTSLEEQMANVRNAISSKLDWERIQARPLLVASIISTIFWGFGDSMAKYFGAT